MILKSVDLKKSFGNKEILKGVNLELKEGDLYGFLGRNGAGKSTFINIISGSMRKTSGNFNIVEKKDFGIMPDVANLYPEMTVEMFLKYMARLKGLKITNQDLKNILEQVSLDVSLNQKVKGFSFGMKKKLSLAQSILGNPKLLILDEPTSGVDPESILHIQKLITKLNKQGVTIFLTSHNLNEIEKLCSYISILKNGKIEIHGTIDDLINKFTNKFEVVIKVDKELSPKDQEEFNNISISDKNTLTFSVNHELEIPQIIERLVSKKVSLFSVTQSKVSLEEIFMN